VSSLRKLAASRGWQFQELELDLDGPEGYLTLKLLELLGIQLGSYNVLTITILTTEALDGNFKEGTEDNRRETALDPDPQASFF